MQKELMEDSSPTPTSFQHMFSAAATVYNKIVPPSHHLEGDMLWSDICELQMPLGFGEIQQSQNFVPGLNALYLETHR